jgi:hypothetical protein
MPQATDTVAFATDKYIEQAFLVVILFGLFSIMAYPFFALPFIHSEQSFITKLVVFESGAALSIIYALYALIRRKNLGEGSSKVRGRRLGKGR